MTVCTSRRTVFRLLKNDIFIIIHSIVNKINRLFHSKIYIYSIVLNYCVLIDITIVIILNIIIVKFCFTVRLYFFPIITK